MKKEPQENPDLPLGWHSEQRRKGRREEPALSAHEDTKAPVYQEKRAFRAGHALLPPRPPPGSSGEPGLAQ